MKRSTLAFFVFIAILIGSGWYYLANKFEKIASEEIIPKIEASEYIHLSDISSVKIDKFKFLIDLGQAQFLKNEDPFSLKVDVAKVFYNPFTDRLILHFGGEKLSFKFGNTEIYAAKPNNYIEFNRSLLNKDFNKFDILYSFGQTAFFGAANNQEISTFKEGSLRFSFEKTEGAYNVLTNIGLEGYQDSLNTLRASTNKICVAINNYAKQKDGNISYEDCLGLQEDILKFFEELKGIYGPANIHLSIDSAVPIKLVDAVISDTGKLTEVLKESDPIKFELVVDSGNASSKLKLAYKINKENNLLGNSAFILMRNDFREESKKQLSVNLVKLFASILDKLKQEHAINHEELADSIGKLLDLDIGIDTNLEVDFSNVDDVIAKAQLDTKFGEKEMFVASSANITDKEIGVRFNFEGEKLDQAIDYSLNYISELMSVLIKINPNTNAESKESLVSYNENRAKIKASVFELMQLLHTEPNYKLGDPFKFEVELKTNPKDFMDIKDIKINNKPYEDYLDKLSELLKKMEVNISYNANL